MAAPGEKAEQQWGRALKRILGDGLRIDEPMSRHTTISVGGPARYLAVPRSARQVAKLVKFALAQGLDFFVLGKGSNLIVRDGGYNGLVIKMDTYLTRVRYNRKTVYAEGGASWARLARTATKQGRTGIEFGIGIPGTVGGAVAMNAGAYGGQVADVLARIRLIDGTGVERVLEAGKVRFDYRETRLPERSVVLSATFNCPPGKIDKETYQRALNRKITQPISSRTFGSTFKNPQGGYAARMIEACGLKGRRRGGAVVSDKHANFIINDKNEASAADVEGLIELMRREVNKQFGVSLKTEVVILGNR